MDLEVFLWGVDKEVTQALHERKCQAKLFLISLITLNLKLMFFTR